MTLNQILVAEDDADGANLIKALLKMAAPDNEVYFVQKGEELLAEALKGIYRLIITDYHLPGCVNSLDIVKEYMKEVKTPTILISAWPNLIKEASDAGCKYFMPKPLQINEFVDTVKKCVYT